MLNLKVWFASTVLTFILFTGGVTFESTHLAHGQFFEDSDTNVTDTDTNVTDTDTNSSSIGSEIVLLSQKLKKASFGSRNLIGQVKNIGTETADYVLVHLTVYNKDGGVIATGETYAEPSTLKAGQKSTFEIFADTADFKGMDYYTLSLDWLNHRDSAQGYVENAQLYESTPNPTKSDVNGAQEKEIPTENPTTVPKSKKSYQLIIYLDNASPQNAIGDNFKILVYNSNNEPILSAKPNIDFNDDHQKISPPKGYPIIYQSGQYPKNIRVCAQQEYQLNGTTYLHNDCFPIIQNVQKTYWYTTFDYGDIDGFEPNSNLTAKSNEN